MGPRERLGDNIKALRALAAASVHEGLVVFEVGRLGLSTVK